MPLLPEFLPSSGFLDIPSDDIDGDSRVAPPDIGSDEYAAAGPTCVDNDGDGYGVCPDCGTAIGCTYDGDDCNDTDEDINPGATETTCNGIDDDCNAGTLDAPDADTDTYDVCNPTDPGDSDGKDADCNDGDDSINPGATDIVCDGIDQDCSGEDECPVIIIDNGDPEFSYVGAWTAYTGYAELYDGDGWYHRASSGSDTATWTPDLPQAGPYSVYAWWKASANRATDAPYTIYYDGGSVTVDVNQEINGDQWNLLGTYPFAPGQWGYVVLSDDANEYVIADAVKFQP